MSVRRLARRLLPERLLRPLRGHWHRIERLDPRLLARRRSFRRLNRGTADGEILLRPGLRLRIDSRSRSPFEWYCFDSQAAVDELDVFLRMRDGRTRLLDVGASHGLFSLAFTKGRPHAQALAIEPSQTAWEALAANLARNPDCRVKSLRLAAGHEVGEIAMRPVWHHLEALAPGEENPDTQLLPVKPLDEICDDLDFRPDLVKIDVEGYEHAVLEGGRRLLSELHPPVLLELHPLRLARLGSSAAEVARRLTACGYRLTSLTGRAVRERDLRSDDSTLHVLCRPLAGHPRSSSPGPEQAA